MQPAPQPNLATATGILGQRHWQPHKSDSSMHKKWYQVHQVHQVHQAGWTLMAQQDEWNSISKPGCKDEHNRLHWHPKFRPFWQDWSCHSWRPSRMCPGLTGTNHDTWVKWWGTPIRFASWLSGCEIGMTWSFGERRRRSPPRTPSRSSSLLPRTSMPGRCWSVAHQASERRPPALWWPNAHGSKSWSLTPRMPEARRWLITWPTPWLATRPWALEPPASCSAVPSSWMSVMAWQVVTRVVFKRWSTSFRWVSSATSPWLMFYLSQSDHWKSLHLLRGWHICQYISITILRFILINQQGSKGDINGSLGVSEVFWGDEESSDLHLQRPQRPASAAAGESLLGSEIPATRKQLCGQAGQEDHGVRGKEGADADVLISFGMVWQIEYRWL